MSRRFDSRPDAFELLKRSGYRRTWRDARDALDDLIGDALNSRFAWGIYLGFVAGCFFTVGAAFVWSRFL